MTHQCLPWLVLFLASAYAAPPPAGPRVSVPVHYADQAVVIATARGAAVVRFTDAIPDGRRYVYRFRPAGAAAEERGAGKVFERYERRPAEPPAEGAEVTDAGGQLRLKAGTLSVEWSLAGEGSGWLYFEPERERVHIVSADAFETLELARFAK